MPIQTSISRRTWHTHQMANRHFYQYECPRPSEQMEADIEGLEMEIMAMLREITA